MDDLYRKMKEKNRHRGIELAQMRKISHERGKGTLESRRNELILGIVSWTIVLNNFQHFLNGISRHNGSMCFATDVA